MSRQDVNLEMLRLIGLDHLQDVAAVNVRIRPMHPPIITVQLWVLKDNLPTTKIIKKFKMVEA